MRRSRLPLPVSLCSAALIGAVLPVTITTHAAAADDGAFSGYSASSWAAPVKVEIYEPTVPVPASPQAELELGYTTTEATSGQLTGRSSFIWPGDPVGEGFVTFAKALGLPEDVYKDGYPVQVNSAYPGGPESQRNEPFPGTMMRTRASAKEVSAVTGLSPDGQPSDPDSGGGSGDGGGGDAPEAPPLPEGQRSGQSDGLTDPVAFGSAITGHDAWARTAAEEDGSEDAPGVPAELAGLVDFTDFTSQSRTTPGADEVVSRSYSALADARILDGVVTFEGISARSVTTSNGSTSEANGNSKVGTVTIAGQTFEMGSKGIKAGGRRVDIPDLPDDPDRALARIGLTVTRPQANLTARKLEAEGLAEAVQIQIDTQTLKQHFDQIPVDDTVGALPDGELKNLISALANLSPRIVITLGNAAARTETIQTPNLPQPPTEAPDAGEPPTDGPGGAGGGAAATDGTSGTSGASTGAPGAAPSEAAPGAADELEDAALTKGLPALNTIPGALTMGGILLAFAAGTWLRRIGVLALGGAASCSHGLDSGLPDLRKA